MLDSARSVCKTLDFNKTKGFLSEGHSYQPPAFSCVMKQPSRDFVLRTVDDPQISAITTIATMSAPKAVANASIMRTHLDRGRQSNRSAWSSGRYNPAFPSDLVRPPPLAFSTALPPFTRATWRQHKSLLIRVGGPQNRRLFGPLPCTAIVR